MEVAMRRQRREGVQVTKADRELRMRYREAEWLMRHWNAPFYNTVDKENALRLWRSSATVGVNLNRQDLSTVLEWVLDNYVFNGQEKEEWWNA